MNGKIDKAVGAIDRINGRSLAQMVVKEMEDNSVSQAYIDGFWEGLASLVPDKMVPYFKDEMKNAGVRR